MLKIKYSGLYHYRIIEEGDTVVENFLWKDFFFKLREESEEEDR